jgi:hypothetical protein
MHFEWESVSSELHFDLPALNVCLKDNKVWNEWQTDDGMDPVINGSHEVFA